MNNKTKTILGIGVFAALFVVAMYAYNGLSERFKPQTSFSLNSANSQPEEKQVEETPVKEETPEPNEENETLSAPDFTAYDNDGNPVKLSDYFGKPIVLNFWTTWCGYCKDEMPYFDKVYNEVKDDIVFLMVDVVDGVQETEEKGKKYIADSGFTFPVLYDLDMDAAIAYGIRAYPTTIVINKDGTVFGGHEGALPEEALREVIDSIKSEDIPVKKAEYNKITAEEAKSMIEANSNAILLDVRTEEEFLQQRIEGAVLIPDYELKDRAEAELPDKDALILIYCRSGNRSKTAANILVAMGYTNVYDFGGITTYPYETISE